MKNILKTIKEWWFKPVTQESDFNFMEEDDWSVAEDIIDGSCCAICGSFFLKTGDEQPFEETSTVMEVFTHGYPVACNGCWEDDCGYEKQQSKAKLL